MPHDELISFLESVPGRVTEAVERIPRAQMRASPPGGWSPSQVIGHLRHSMEIFEGRIDRILAEQQPAIRGWDQDEDALAGDYNSVEPAQILEGIAGSRERTVALLRGMDEAQWQRSGIHEDPEIGEFTLLWIGEHIREHEQEHLADLEAAATT